MNAKALISLIVFSVTLLCSKAQTNVAGGAVVPKESQPEVFVEGGDLRMNKAYRISELKQIAVDFAKQKNIDFDFTNRSCSIVIYTGRFTNIIASVSFGGERVGKRFYDAEINRVGNVETYHIGVRPPDRPLP